MDHINKHLQKANLELVKQELKPPAITEESELGIALKEKKINKLPIESLKQTLRLVYFMVGLRADNWPKDVEKDLLHNYIVENYGGHTVSEIKLAFTMAITGKLNMDQKDVTCYENFSILYFSSIMNAYREWSKQAITSLPKPKEAIKTPPKWQIDLEFAIYKLRLINKLPCKINI